MPTLKNTNPLGAVDLPLIGRTLQPGEEFEVTAEQAGQAPVPTEFNKDDSVKKEGDLGSGLLAQVGNYELVTEKKG